MDSLLTQLRCCEMINVLVIGDNAVGKTSLIHYIVHNMRMDNPTTTVGIDFCTIYTHNDEQVHIWDIDGEHTLKMVNHRKFHHVFVVCDVHTLDTIPKWRQMINTTDAQITAIVNKCDLLNNSTQMDFELDAIYASASTGFNVDLCRQILCKSTTRGHQIHDRTHAKHGVYKSGCLS